MLDYPLVFSEDQVETTAADHYSTNSIDFGVAAPSHGNPTPWLVVEVEDAVTAAAGSTLTVILQEDSATGFGSVRTLLASRAFDANAGIASGTKLLCVPLPQTHQRYLRLDYLIGTDVLITGSFNAYITLTPPTNH